MASSAPATTWAARARWIPSSQSRFEQLGVGENDAELVVQAVEQCREVAERGGCRLADTRRLFTRHGGVDHSSLLPASSPGSGSRQRVSTKMRTDPPAVLMY